MIKYDDSELYPLREKQIYLGDELYVDRANRGKSWFILDLALFEDKFIPKNATGFKTVDGSLLLTTSRRGINWYTSNNI